jgi:hypothetical protein
MKTLPDSFEALVERRGRKTPGHSEQGRGIIPHTPGRIEQGEKILCLVVVGCVVDGGKPILIPHHRLDKYLKLNGNLDFGTIS